jgi:hypothetical protein
MTSTKYTTVDQASMTCHGHPGRGDPLMTSTKYTTVDQASMTREQRAALPLSTEVAQMIAEDHGVCIRPLAMRRIDTITGRVDVVPVPCGSTREDQCRPCAEKARRLRMAQCREGWHLEAEPVIERTKPSEEQQELMAARADLFTAYAERRAVGDEVSCEQISESVTELDIELRALGVRGRLTPLDPPAKPVRRSTRRRQDAPNLPRRPIERRTVGRVFGGRYRPSTFITLTLESYGRVDSNGAAVAPDGYDYRRRHEMRSTSRPWSIGSGRTPGAVSGGTCSTSAPSSPKNAVLRISTPPSGVQFPAPSYARLWRRRITRCGGHPMITLFTAAITCQPGTPAQRPSPTRLLVHHCPPSVRPAKS